MKTAERILEAAIELFNAEGVGSISLRRVADEVGISHSNLAYHFADKTEIIDGIYTRMEAEMDESLSEGGEVDIAYLHRLLVLISDFHESYRFFYLDLAELARHHLPVIKRYRKTVARRFVHHEKMMAILVQNGYLKREPVVGLYRSLFHSIWVMSTFWLQHREVLGEDHTLAGSSGEVDHVWEILLPYLTVKGLRQFDTVSGERDRPLALLHLGRFER